MSLDRNQLRELLALLGDERASLVELIQTFLEDLPAIGAQFGDAAGDHAALARAAHTLRSSAQDFGAVRLAQLCARLEQECRLDRVSDADTQLRDIFSELERVESELRRIAEGGPVGPP